MSVKKFSVGYCTRGQWKGHFLQGTRKTQPCITGHPVQYQDLFFYAILMFQCREACPITNGLDTCHNNCGKIFFLEREAAKKSYFFNGSTIKALTPHPMSLMAVGTLAVGKIMSPKKIFVP